jgi:hypothetical protein
MHYVASSNCCPWGCRTCTHGGGQQQDTEHVLQEALRYNENSGQELEDFRGHPKICVHYGQNLPKTAESFSTMNT